MIKNYFKVGLRNLISQRGYTLINIAGLAIGIASALMIMLYVTDELSYDSYHPNTDRIYRLGLNAKMMGTEFSGPITAAPMGAAMMQDYPQVKSYCRVFNFIGTPVIKFGEKCFVERHITFADSTFFQVFNGLTLLQGDPSKVLTRPHTIVLTESIANKYFGHENPVGKTVYMGNEKTAYEVSGVAKDFPLNSHFHFELIASMNSMGSDFINSTVWISNNFYTYILLENKDDAKIIESKFPEIVKKYIGPQVEQFLGISQEQFSKGNNVYGFTMQNIKDIHLHSQQNFEIEPGGSLIMVYVFMIIAFFILAIASINFMNLATARSAKRAKEVGIRKVVGSTKSQLIYQFLTESIILTFFSLVIAIGIVALVLPYFNILAEKQLSITTLPVGITLVTLLGIIVAVGLLAGSYPAFFLARFQPLQVLKGKLRSGASGVWLRGVLVVIQFIITIGLLISTFVVYNQVHYTRSKDLGFDRHNGLIINRAFTVPSDKRDAFLKELAAIPGVKSVSLSGALPSTLIGSTVFLPEGSPSQETNVLSVFNTDWDFAKTLNLKMVEGRYFSRDFASDSTALIINEAAVKSMGLKEPIVGTKIIVNTSQHLTVIGVVKDFNFESLHNKINPLAIQLNKNDANYITLKYADGANVNSIIKAGEEKWKEFAGTVDPYDYSFFDQMLDIQYKDDQRAGYLFTIFSILAIFIAALGLFGLASFTAEQRTREVGIRKVMGAQISTIVFLLLKEINKLFIIATIVAWPIAYFLMHSWLNNFAFRIDLSPWPFIAASLIAYAIAVATVIFQTIKAARTSPSITLKYE